MNPVRPVTPRRFLLVSLGVVGWLVLAAVAVGAVDGGRVVPVGDSADHGDLDGLELNDPVVGLAVTPSGDGYWMVASDGGVFGFGDARFKGSMGAVRLNQPVVGIAATPSGDGYWLVARDGGVFSFGDAQFWGSTGAMVLNQPIVGMAPTPSGDGYWLVARDGGVFSFGDAWFWGSTGAIALSSPIRSMAVTPSGNGYWLMGEDGGVFTFGDAGYWGSGPEVGATAAFVAIAPSASGDGYALVTSTGEVLEFGDATLSEGAVCDQAPVVAAGNDRGVGAVLLRRSAAVPTGPATSASSGMDGDHLLDLISHAQSCQTARTPTPGEFRSPLEGAKVTSRFGIRVHPVWRVALPHAGLDLIGSGGPAGTPVLAVADGVVLDVAPRVAYGTTVVVDHGGRIATVSAHLGSTSVSVGDVVTRGQPLGTMGATGFATGAHLHFEIRLDGVAVDPEPYLAGSPYPSARVATRRPAS